MRSAISYNVVSINCDIMAVHSHPGPHPPGRGKRGGSTGAEVRGRKRRKGSEGREWEEERRARREGVSVAVCYWCL